MRRCFAFLFLCSGFAHAQRYEFGVFGGGGFLGQSALPSTPGITAGLQAGASAGAFLAQNLYASLGGEVRYEFQQRSLRVAGASSSATFPARAHVLQYDLLWHAGSTRRPLRPYVMLGGGFKLYQGTGAEAAWRPLMDIAYLTRTQEWSPMVAAGGGVQWRFGRRTLLRLDVRDQLTRFPGRVITPAPGTKLPGWVHDVTPTAGIAWVF